ncbi:MAG: kynureninase [Flavobacteriales bacterium]|nr:kynureninase [Flavobacteriales bacterium]MBP9080416.1 kynureninase [Flavobacteriales bacterium]
MLPENTLESARQWDAQDPLNAFRGQFLIPKVEQQPIIYFTGNSLGLQPADTEAAIKRELEDWARFGVEGHFHARHPWFSYHERFAAGAGSLVGGRLEEVVLMNQLTTNLHFLLVSFYRPKGKRVKVLTEHRPFPSDTYALASQIAFHGLDPKECLVEMQPREGEHNLRTEDILAKVHELGDELALVLFGGVNYFTGQAFHMEAITAKAHEAGAVAGFDLAHAAGNIPLQLHDWNVDFACWCTYKYLNSGPGSVGGAFVHERHLKSDLPRLAGWWGHDKKTRFQMGPAFSAMQTAEGWQVSNAPVFNMVVHSVALAQFVQARMDRLRTKSLQLTGYAEAIINGLTEKHQAKLEIITPKDPGQRGCQLSILAHGKGKGIHARLTERAVSVDWRESSPGSATGAGVIRMAPVPMYNSFEDVFRFGEILKECMGIGS